MIVVKYLFGVWAAVLLYTSLTVSFGAKGISAYHQLDGERARQEANIESLMLINRNLENTMNSLRYDEDSIAVFAREQGYATGAERFIRIVGLGGYQKSQTVSGGVIAAAVPQYIPNRTLRIIAFFTGATILLCMAAFDLMRFLRG